MGLVERDDTLASLEGLLAGAVMGRGRIVLVSGPVAVGKSALLQGFAEQAIELGALAVTATGSRSERDLPLGILRQLVQDSPLVPVERRRAMALLDEGARAATTAESTQPIDAQIVHALCGIMLELSERYPLLLTVDDVHHADRVSLLCLAYLARRVRVARILMVFSHADRGRYTDTYFQTDLLRQPHCRTIPLAPLSWAGVRALTGEQVGRRAAERFADDWYALSGGNPLLAAALADDYADFVKSTHDSPGKVVVADRYGRAVLSCLHRAEPQTLAAARGLAILGDADALPELLEVDGSHVTRELHDLTLGGLVTLGTFRHEAARAAVLSEMEPQERERMHRRAAELVHAAGAPAGVVAEQLLRAGALEAPWVVAILQEAARGALREGQVEAGVSYLRLAARECDDEAQRTKITTMLLRAEWRINPGAPAARMAELADAVHRGGLRACDALVLIRALLWHGRLDDARAVLEQLGDEDVTGPETATELLVARLWLRATYPPLLAHLRRQPGEVGDDPVVSVADSRRLESALILAEVLSQTPREDVTMAVVRILQGSRLDEMSLETVESSLLALTYAGYSDNAGPWCDLFSVEASSRHAPSRQARLAAIRAEIAIRQGDLPAAEHHARIALDVIPLSSWGVAVGWPLSSLIHALTAMGEFDAARDHLEQPMRDALFQTRYGLHYLHAKGRYSLAVGYPALALRDFQRCGELMAAWNLDTSGLIAWRVDAAEACLRMNRPEQARQLVEAELARGGAQGPRAKGMALRVLAAASDERQRPALLRQAAGFLQTGGDRYELARALCDLVQAYQALGEDRRAAMIASRAHALAKECRAEPLLGPLSRALSRGPAGAPSGFPDVPDSRTGTVVAETRLPSSPDAAPAAAQTAASQTAAPDVTRALSEAERRVALLAAAGYSNREIAGKLFITISTVEQHLTRTYRKLNITRREDLPSILDFGEPGGAARKPGVADEQGAWH